MTSSANLEIVISAINQTNQTLRQIKQDLQGIETPAKSASTSLGGLYKLTQTTFALKGVQEGIGFLKSATQAAAEDAASVARLKQAVDNTGSSYSDYSKQIEDVIKKGQNLGFTDDQTRSGLAILTAQTGNAAEAMKRYALAQDLSRGANIDVVTASRLLGKVTEENVNVLNRYGIVVRKGASDTELFAAIQQKFGGQAAAFADTAAGKMAIFNDRVNEAKESIGKLATPGLTNLATNAAFAVEQLTKIPDALSGLQGKGTFSIGSIDVSKSILGGLIPGYGLLTTSINGTDEKQKQFNHDMQLFNDIVGRTTGYVNAFDGALTPLQQHLAGLNPSLTDLSVTTRGLVNAEVDSIRTTQQHNEVTQQAYAYIATLTDARSKAITAQHEAELADKAEADAARVAADAKRQQDEAARAYAQTLPGMVAALYDEANATEMQKQALAEYNRQRGIATDLEGNAIPTLQELVNAQLDSVDASIRQSQAAQLVAQNSFPRLVEQEKQSILAAQAMAKAHAKAAEELGIVEDAANGAAGALDRYNKEGLYGSMFNPNNQYSGINQYGGTGAPGSSTFYGSAVPPQPGETNAQYVARTSGGGSVTSSTVSAPGGSVSFYSHATGLNYVPYDNYPALLHKGEQVVPANQVNNQNKTVNIYGGHFYMSSGGSSIPEFQNLRI